MKKVLVILLFGLFAVQGLGQGLTQNQIKKKSFSWIRSQDITNTRYFIWHGDTIDFVMMTDSLYLLKSDSALYVTHPFLDSVIATLPGGHSPVTIDGSPIVTPLHIVDSTQVLSIDKASTVDNGYLAWDDFRLFLGKLDWVEHDTTLIGLGTDNEPLKVDTTFLKNMMYPFIESLQDTGDWTGTWFGHDTTYFITVIEDDPFGASWNGDPDATTKNSLYDYLTGLSITGETNLSYTASATQGQVNSDTGDDVILPAATSTNAGLMLPAEKTKLQNLNYDFDTIYTVKDEIFPIEYLKYSAGGDTVDVTNIPKPTGVYSGGVVIWDSLLVFNVSPCAYYIGGDLFLTSTSSVSLSAADGTNSRIDVIAVNTSGNVEVITGTPSTTPQEPSIDYSTQIKLTSVLVLANAVTPIPVDSVFTEYVVYNENTEWTGGYSGVVVDFSSTNAAQKDTISAEAYSTVTGDYVYWETDTALSIENLETFSFWLKLKAEVSKKNSLYLRLKYEGELSIGTAILLPFDYSITDWQLVSLNLNDLSFIQDSIDRVELYWYVNTGTNTGWYIDNVKFQGGYEQVNVSGYIVLNGDVIGEGSEIITVTVLPDSHPHSYSTLPNIVASVDGVVNDGGDIDLAGEGMTVITPDDGGDSIVIESHVTRDTTLDGDGTPGNPLGVDTTVIAPVSLVDSLNSNVMDSLTVHREEINNLKDSIATHRTEITNIYDSLTVHRTDIDKLYDTVNVHRTEIDNFNDTITEFRIEMNNLDADNWGTQVVISDATLSGNGTYASPLSVVSWNLGMQSLSGTSPTWNVDNGLGATLTITGNTTITLSNLEAGMTGNIDVTCNASGYTLTFAGVTNIDVMPYLDPSGIVITTTNSAGAKDTYSWWYTGSVLKINGTKDYAKNYE